MWVSSKGRLLHAGVGPHDDRDVWVLHQVVLICSIEVVVVPVADPGVSGEWEESALVGVAAAEDRIALHLSVDFLSAEEKDGGDRHNGDMMKATLIGSTCNKVGINTATALPYLCGEISPYDLKVYIWL